MFNDLNFLNGSHKKVSNYPWKLVWWVFWQDWNGVQMWHMILEPQHYVEVCLFCWHLQYIHLLLVSLNMCQSRMEENWSTCRRTQGHLSQHSQADRQAGRQLTVTSKSIFQLTFFTPAAAFSISIQVTDPFGYWCITAFMTEYSDCNMWSWHSAAGTLRCPSRFKIPDIGRCVFLLSRRF